MALFHYLGFVLILINHNANRILIIDEPELSLHPGAQKTLATLLSSEARHRQIIVCTHSPYFTSWEDFQNGAKFIRLNKPNDTQCEVSCLGDAKEYARIFKKKQDKWYQWQKPQLLDLVAKEILFTEKILFVEGQEDVGLIRKWFADNNKQINFDIFGYGVGGSGNMPCFLKMASDLGLQKVAALYDSGEGASTCYNNMKKEYPSYHFEKLPTEDMRDKEGKEGVFDKSGTLKEKYTLKFEYIMDEFIKYFN